MKVLPLSTVFKIIVFATLISTVTSFCSYNVSNDKGHLKCDEPSENVIAIFVSGGNHIPEIRKDFFDAFPKVTSINIGLVGIEKIEPGAFDGLKLKYLQLSQNRIKKIENGTFNSLSTTTMLEVFYNHLESVEADVFLGMESLVWLSLSGNHIKYIYKESFNGLNKLQNLFITGNKVEALDVDTFNYLPSLTILELARNNIKQLQYGVFSRQRNLETLTISWNQLEVLPNNLFYNLTALNTLDLAFNHIKELQEDLFNGIENLKYLKFNFNNVSHLNTKAILPRLPQLKEVELFKNPWNCKELNKMREDFLRKAVFVPVFVAVTDKPNVDGVACIE